MTGLLSFVGTPDWRSAVLAALFALPWLVLLGQPWLRRRWLWLAVLVGAALFPFSIAWVQVPAQRGLSSLWLRLLGAPGIQRYLLLVAVPSVLVASLVQEGVKLLVAIGALRLSGEQRSPRAGLGLGAAAGAGFGGLEAFWIFNVILASGWSWATVQLGGPQALLGFVERLHVVPFHVGSAALLGYGYARGQPWRYLLVTVALHTLVNYSTVVLQAGLISLVGLEVWAALVAAATIGAALILRWRGAPGEDRVAR